ncbi:MAG: hypothetical protein SFX19_03250 [Alphaproteobacteria bacterium]|nr:hypothetical protein [Alphaproteobacteria bacterium]
MPDNHENRPDSGPAYIAPLGFGPELERLLSQLGLNTQDVTLKPPTGQGARIVGWTPQVHVWLTEDPNNPFEIDITETSDHLLPTDKPKPFATIPLFDITRGISPAAIVKNEFPDTVSKVLDAIDTEKFSAAMGRPANMAKNLLASSLSVMVRDKMTKRGMDYSVRATTMTDEQAEAAFQRQYADIADPVARAGVDAVMAREDTHFVYFGGEAVADHSEEKIVGGRSSHLADASGKMRVSVASEQGARILVHEAWHSAINAAFGYNISRPYLQGSDVERVGKLVDDVFAPTRLDADKQTALEAIKQVLGKNIEQDISYKDANNLKQRLVQAIDASYSSEPNKFLAFIDAVKKPDVGLAPNNPLVLHQREIGLFAQSVRRDALANESGITELKDRLSLSDYRTKNIPAEVPAVFMDARSGGTHVGGRWDRLATEHPHLAAYVEMVVVPTVMQWKERGFAKPPEFESPEALLAAHRQQMLQDWHLSRQAVEQLPWQKKYFGHVQTLDLGSDGLEVRERINNSLTPNYVENQRVYVVVDESRKFVQNLPWKKTKSDFGRDQLELVPAPEDIQKLNEILADTSVQYFVEDGKILVPDAATFGRLFPMKFDDAGEHIGTGGAAREKLMRQLSAEASAELEQSRQKVGALPWQEAADGHVKKLPLAALSPEDLAAIEKSGVPTMRTADGFLVTVSREAREFIQRQAWLTDDLGLVEMRNPNRLDFDDVGVKRAPDPNYKNVVQILDAAGIRYDDGLSLEITDRNAFDKLFPVEWNASGENIGPRVTDREKFIAALEANTAPDTARATPPRPQMQQPQQQQQSRPMDDPDRRIAQDAQQRQQAGPAAGDKPQGQEVSAKSLREAVRNEEAALPRLAAAQQPVVLEQQARPPSNPAARAQQDAWHAAQIARQQQHGGGPGAMPNPAQLAQANAGASPRPPVDVAMAHYAGQEVIDLARSAGIEIEHIESGGFRIAYPLENQSRAMNYVAALHSFAEAHGVTPSAGNMSQQGNRGVYHIEFPRGQTEYVEHLITELVNNEKTGLTPEQTEVAKIAGYPEVLKAQHAVTDLMHQNIQNPGSVPDETLRAALERLDKAKSEASSPRRQAQLRQWELQTKNPERYADPVPPPEAVRTPAESSSAPQVSEHDRRVDRVREVLKQLPPDSVSFKPLRVRVNEMDMTFVLNGNPDQLKDWQARLGGPRGAVHTTLSEVGGVLQLHVSALDAHIFYEALPQPMKQHLAKVIAVAEAPKPRPPAQVPDAPDTPVRAPQPDAPDAPVRMAVSEMTGAGRATSGGASMYALQQNAANILRYAGEGKGVGVAANMLDGAGNLINIGEMAPGAAKHIPASLSKLAQRANYPLAAVMVGYDVYDAKGNFINEDGGVGAKGRVLAVNGSHTFVGMAASGQIAAEMGAAGTAAMTARGVSTIFGGGLLAGTAVSWVVGDAVDAYNTGIKRSADLRAFTQELAEMKPSGEYHYLRGALDDIRSGKLRLTPGHPFNQYREGGVIKIENIDLSNPQNLSLISGQIANAYKLQDTIGYEADGVAREEQFAARTTARRYELALKELDGFNKQAAGGTNPVLGLIPNEKKEMLDLTQYFTQTQPEVVPLEQAKQHDAAMLRFIELTEKSRMGQPPEVRAALDKGVADMQKARVEFAAMLPEKRANFDLRMELKAEMSRYDFRVAHYTKTEGKIPDEVLPDHIASLDRISRLVEKITPGEASREMRAQLAVEMAQAEAALQAQKERESAVEEKKPAVPMLEVPEKNPIASAEATRQKLGGLPISEQDKAMFAALLGANSDASRAVSEAVRNHNSNFHGSETEGPDGMRVATGEPKTRGPDVAPRK